MAAISSFAEQPASAIMFFGRCFVFSLLSAIGFAASSRGAVAGSREAVSLRYQAAERELKAEIDNLLGAGARNDQDRQSGCWRGGPDWRGTRCRFPERSAKMHLYQWTKNTNTKGTPSMRTALGLSMILVASSAMAQTRGTATDILNADIQAMAKALAATPGGDELLGVSSINNGEYNVGVAVVHRAKAANIQASLAHHQITEVYHVLSGAGTMVSGGTMDNPRETTDAHTIAVVGPSARGGKLAGGQSRKIGAGDVVVIPPDTPHGWSDVSEDLVYLVVRMDPKKVLKVK